MTGLVGFNNSRVGGAVQIGEVSGNGDEIRKAITSGRSFRLILKGDPEHGMTLKVASFFDRIKMFFSSLTGNKTNFDKATIAASINRVFTRYDYSALKDEDKKTFKEAMEKLQGKFHKKGDFEDLTGSGKEVENATLHNNCFRGIISRLGSEEGYTPLDLPPVKTAQEPAVVAVPSDKENTVSQGSYTNKDYRKTFGSEFSALRKAVLKEGKFADLPKDFRVLHAKTIREASPVSERTPSPRSPGSFSSGVGSVENFDAFSELERLKVVTGNR